MTHDNIIPMSAWGPVKDYPERYVRPNLYSSIAEQERRARVEADVRRDLRVMRWQSRIKWLCVAVVVFAVVYFAVQLGRGVL